MGPRDVRVWGESKRPLIRPTLPRRRLQPRGFALRLTQLLSLLVFVTCASIHGIPGIASASAHAEGERDDGVAAQRAHDAFLTAGPAYRQNVELPPSDDLNALEAEGSDEQGNDEVFHFVTPTLFELAPPPRSVQALPTRSLRRPTSIHLATAFARGPPAARR